MALSDIARKAERTINRVGRKRKSAKGWRPAITGFSGYGSTERVHVLGRVLMRSPEFQPGSRPWSATRTSM